MGVSVDEVSVPAEDNPAGDGGGLSGGSGKCWAQGWWDAGTAEVEQGEQVRSDRPDNYLGARVVMPTDEVGGQGLKIVK